MQSTTVEGTPSHVPPSTTSHQRREGRCHLRCGGAGRLTVAVGAGHGQRAGGPAQELDDPMTGATEADGPAVTARASGPSSGMAGTTRVSGAGPEAGRQPSRRCAATRPPPGAPGATGRSARGAPGRPGVPSARRAASSAAGPVDAGRQPVHGVGRDAHHLARHRARPRPRQRRHPTTARSPAGQVGGHPDLAEPGVRGPCPSAAGSPGAAPVPPPPGRPVGQPLDRHRASTASTAPSPGVPSLPGPATSAP